MEKMSVIIPTMWKVDGFLNQLKKLSKIEVIGEIILIDNTENTNLLEIPKVIHILQGKNTYINPAWNKGVNLAKWDKVCIMNDDVEVHDELFINILPHITEDKGMIGLHEYHGNGVWEDEPGCDRTRSEMFRGDRGLPLKLIESEIGHRRPGYACLWFIHKNSYVQIPDELKVWYGDDWVYYKSGKPNFSMLNVDIIGKPSQTTDLPFLDDVKRQDQKNWERLYN